MHNNRWKVWLPLVFSVIMILGMVFGYKMKEKMPATARLFSVERRGVLQEVMDLIDKRYVDNVNSDTLADAAIGEMLKYLDPHSVFIPASSLQSKNEELAGKFEGIGIEFNIYSDTMHVLNVLKGGPSEAAGLEIGDKFLSIGDSVVTGNISNEKVRNLLRGIRGSKINVNLLRNGVEKAVEITRGIIPLYSLDASYIIAPKTGYLRLNKFSETTYEEFMEGMQVFKEAGIEKMILDLRGNGGGILQEAVEITDEFLEGNKLIVYTQGKDGRKQEFSARRQGLFEDGKLVVLIDEGSASASEILAGALQDWDRATVIGRKSFGKGLVQEQYNLRNGAALRLTIARYYTPLGRSIQRPYTEGVEAYNNEMFERYHSGALTQEDSTHTGEAFTTPDGQKLYGGGGITPSIFIPIDTSSYSAFVTQLFQQGVLNHFAYHYYISHQADLKLYPNVAGFSKGFDISDETWRTFIAFAKESNIPIDRWTLEDRKFIETRIKALLARQLWQTNGYFEVINQQDAGVQKALQVLQ